MCLDPTCSWLDFGGLRSKVKVTQRSTIMFLGHISPKNWHKKSQLETFCRWQHWLEINYFWAFKVKSQGHWKVILVFWQIYWRNWHRDAKLVSFLNKSWDLSLIHLVATSSFFSWKSHIRTPKIHYFYYFWYGYYCDLAKVKLQKSRRKLIKASTFEELATDSKKWPSFSDFSSYFSSFLKLQSIEFLIIFRHIFCLTKGQWWMIFFIVFVNEMNAGLWQND